MTLDVPRRARVAMVAAVIGLVVLASAACKRDRGTATPTPAVSATTPVTPSVTPSMTSSPTPTASPIDPLTVLAGDGIGPYVIGTAMADLQARALLTNIIESPHCTVVHNAQATGRFAGQLTLMFRQGRLVAIYTNSAALRTPSGARVGMTLTEVQNIYGARGTLITGASGNKGFIVLVPASGLAVSFSLDVTNTRVNSIGAGEAAPQEDAIRSGEGC